VGVMEGAHHFIVRFFQMASWAQPARLASWSYLERIISEPGGMVRAMERLRISWVVLGPQMTVEGEGALMYFDAARWPAE
jgi:hypothetical protein